jgi:predicted nucleic-acid-binding protein
MLAIDTNIIVRYLIGDDAAQTAKARRLIDNNDTFVCTTVLLETEWVLRSAYGISTHERLKALTNFAGLPRVTVENASVVANALEWAAKGLDFADGLHLAQAAGCEEFLSFDQTFAKAANALGGIKVRAP